MSEGVKWESVGFSTLRRDPGYIGNFSFARDFKGRIWVVWECFDGRQESILARCWDGHRLSQLYVVSVAPTCYMPQVTTDHVGNVWVAWSSKKRKRWNIYARCFDGRNWRKELNLTSGNGDNLRPSIGTDSQGRIWVVWERHKDHKSLINARIQTSGKWSREILISNLKGDSYRPQLCMGRDGEAYIIWDTYKDDAHNIFARRYSNERWLDIQQISSDSKWELMPAVTIDSSNHPWVAWLCSTDVTDKCGVIDQWPTLRCARYDGNEWQLCKEPDGTLDLAILCHGLLPKVDPKVGVWGYLGRRRQAMLVADERGGIWLLWERKREPDGKTGEVLGVLCGRYFYKEKWSEPVELHVGQRFYATSNNIAKTDNKIWICAKDLHPIWAGETIGDIRVWSADTPSPHNCLRLYTEGWVGWTPVALSRKKERKYGQHEVDVRGAKYRLYLGDPHFHSVLSADAEGEVDELLHYARDKAGLDFCVITDNDFYYLPMTSSQWALNQLYTEEFDYPRKFVVFSGYEWTIGNWIAKTGGGYDGHRSIIYLTSDQPIFRWTDAGSQDIEELSRCIEKTNGIMHAHHQEWNLIQSSRECNVEVCSGWNVYIDDPEYIHRHLSKGHVFGFIGGTDSHRRNPSLGGALTGVFAKELTRAAIFEALKKRRCYATNGSRIIVDFRINNAFMGERCRIEENPRIQVHTIGTRRLLSVDIYRNGGVIYSKSGTGKELQFEYFDPDCPPGESYYYVRVTQEGESPWYPSNVKVAKGNRAWSSPIWVNK